MCAVSGEWESGCVRYQVYRNDLQKFSSYRIENEALRQKPEAASSIPDGVIGIFHLHNPSGRTVALGSTQPLKEMRG
jgi:hypothetical protein